MDQLIIKMKKHGIDTDGVITRLGGNEMLYLTICKKFLNDTSYPSVLEAIEKGNYIEARIHLHTLKGVAANLGFLYLHTLCSRLLVELEQEALSYFNRDLVSLGEEYDIIISILNESF